MCSPSAAAPYWKPDVEKTTLCSERTPQSHLCRGSLSICPYSRSRECSCPHSFHCHLGISSLVAARALVLFQCLGLWEDIDQLVLTMNILWRLSHWLSRWWWHWTLKCVQCQRSLAVHTYHDDGCRQGLWQLESRRSHVNSTCRFVGNESLKVTGAETFGLLARQESHLSHAH